VKSKIFIIVDLHPEIVIRSKMKLKGINRCRIKTETQKSKYEKADSTATQSYISPKVQSMTTNYE
jgi:hypothetical protein